MSSGSAAQAAIGAATHELHLPSDRAEHNLSEIAARERQSHLGLPGRGPVHRGDDHTDRPPAPGSLANRGSPPEPLADSTPEAFRTIGAETLGHLALLARSASPGRQSPLADR